jgi:hypothetical protein
MRHTTGPLTYVLPVFLATTIAVCLTLGAGMVLDRQTPSNGDEDLGEAYDAGRVFSDSRPVVERTFRVTNRGSKPIRLINKSCTCTCTTSRLSREILSPGESASFKMSIRMPAGYSGKSTVRCDLRFDDDRVRTFTISYESFPRILVENVYLNFGTIDPTADPDAEAPEQRTWLDLFAPQGERLASLKSIPELEGFEISTTGGSEVSELEGIQTRRYEVRIKAKPAVLRSSPGGSHARTVTFASDDGSTALVTVMWRQLDRYTVSPSPVHFGMVKADGSSKEMKVLVSAHVEPEIAIRSITSDSEYLVPEVDGTAPDGSTSSRRGLRLVLKVPHDFTRDALSGMVRIEIADRQATSVPIPWSAFVRNATGSTEGMLTVDSTTGEEKAR